MAKIRIRGGRRLNGEIPIAGAKNAALPLMAASLLTDETLTLSNLPELADIATLVAVLSQHGVKIEERPRSSHRRGNEEGRTLSLGAARITNTTAPYELVRRMRASVLVLGPLVARCGEARVSIPGGCAIGTRPVDLHFKGLERLGARISLEDGYIVAEAPGGLTGAHIQFPTVSVGATENLLMAATLAEGRTVLASAAREPEVSDLARCLTRMGARIDGIDSDCLTVEGVRRLHGATYAVLPDRIETGTYAMAAAVTDGELELMGADLGLLEAVAEKLAEAGVVIEPTQRGAKVRCRDSVVKATDVTTRPYPGFPTDLQAQMMALMAIAKGASVVTETVFEDRFMHVPELARLGADITVHGPTAMVRGVARLTGAPVMATDIRASVSLVLAGLAAQGETVVDRIYHLDRGYERLVDKLAVCGAEIERVDS
ncbi:MAG: UDP-N-acetylglucosamine 1-carboxyvinyltransferase [Alphaproteobacteria bacterium]